MKIHLERGYTKEVAYDEISDRIYKNDGTQYDLILFVPSVPCSALRLLCAQRPACNLSLSPSLFSDHLARGEDLADRRVIGPAIDGEQSGTDLVRSVEGVPEGVDVAHHDVRHHDEARCLRSWLDQDQEQVESKSVRDVFQIVPVDVVHRGLGKVLLRRARGDAGIARRRVVRVL